MYSQNANNNEINPLEKVIIIQKEKCFKKVGTHSGRFHADEVMATAILQEVFDIEVIRTRDVAVLNGLDIVYDVGGGEFDHHDVEKVYRDNGTPYAACGLIWRKFGREVVRLVEPSLPEEEQESVFSQIDAVLIESIDASDNGLKTYDTIIPTLSISTMISGFNPVWYVQASEDEAFFKAVEVASAVLKNTLQQKIAAAKAKGYVAEAYRRRDRPEVLMLEGAYPWQYALYDLDVEKEVLFVVYPKDRQYLIQTVRGGKASGDRKRLPRAWAGKRDEELGEVIGIDDAVFCHPARFIAGAESKDSILKMADIAVAEPEVKRRKYGFLQRLIRRLFKR